MATIEEISGNTPGAMQYIDGGRASMLPPTVPEAPKPSTPTPTAPVPSPLPTPSPVQPDIRTELARITQEANEAQAGIDRMRDQEMTVGQSFASPEFEKGPTYAELYPDIDEDRVRKQTMKLFQGQIDATNQIYDQMLNEARMEGQGRLGSQRAMAARGGLLGSDFGAAQKSKVQGYNTDVNRAIQAERAAKIGEILGTVRSSVTEELAEKRAARQQGAENYLNFLKNESTRKQGNINLAATALLTQGIDPATLDENELGAIAMEAGTSPQNLIMAYQQMASQQSADAAATDLETRKTEAEIAKIENDIAQGKIKTIGEGTMLYNTETGETFKNPKTYAPTAASGLKIGAGILNQEAVADVHAALQETRGSDGYANTGTYLEELEGFVALGGDPKDFVKEYDPDIYINPNDPTRSFLQSQMKKPPSDNLFLGSLGGIDIGSAIAEAESGN